MALKLEYNTGTVVGRMHALSAVGSIIGTFICGYWLVQWIWNEGHHRILCGHTVPMAPPFLSEPKRGAVVLIAGLTAALLLLLVTWQKDGFASPCNVESSYYCLRVEDERNSFGFILESA